MKKMIGIAVFSAMAGVVFAGGNFELNRITGKDISQAAASEISVKVPEPEKKGMLFVAAANPALAGSFDLNRLGAEEIKGLETPIPAVGVPGAGTKTAPIENLGWRHVGLRAEDGTDVKIDYNLAALGNRVIATPTWINVSNPVLKGNENATAVLINYYDNTNQIESTQNIVLKYADNGRFTGQAGRIEVLERSHNGATYYNRQEIAVVVDGRWLVDPVAGGHNFKFNMAR